VTKKGRQLFGRRKVEKCTPREKIIGTHMKKGPRLKLVWGPRMINPALL